MSKNTSELDLFQFYRDNIHLHYNKPLLLNEVSIDSIYLNFGEYAARFFEGDRPSNDKEMLKLLSISLQNIFNKREPINYLAIKKRDELLKHYTEFITLILEINHTETTPVTGITK